MEIIKKATHINFVGRMKLYFTLSIIAIIISIISVIWHGGLNYGIDFAGGTLVQVKFQQVTTTEKLRHALRPIKLDSSIIQQFSSQEFVVRTAESTSDLKGLSGQIEESLNNVYG
jgi:preprotein translocase subunit SecF